MNAAKRDVFLVDDHPLVLEGLERIFNAEPDLRCAGVATTTQLALSKLALATPLLIVTDLSLGISSGYEFIEELTRTFPAIPVLVLSMHEEPRCAERALAAGARGYVTKSSSTEEILDAARQILLGGTYVPQNILRHLLQRSETPAVTLETLLSVRELEVFRMLGLGYKVKRIALDLNLSSKTVDSHCANIKSKLKLSDTHELVQKATIWTHENSKSSKNNF